MAVKTNQTWTLYKTNGSQDESNMNSLHNKWLSRRFKHELSTQQIAVKTIQTWTLYKTNSSQDDSNILIFCVFCYDFCIKTMFGSSLPPIVWFVLTAICFVEFIFWFVLTTISFVESSCLIRLDCYKTNGSQDESNMKSLQKK
jgi:hypothetical protein